MDFAFTPKQVELQQWVRQIAEEKIAPIAEEADESPTVHAGLMAILANEGLLKYCVGAGIASLANELFLTVQDPIVTVQFGLGLHTDDIGAGVGFGQSKGGDALASGNGWQVFGLLFVGAAQRYGVAAQTLHNEVGVRLAGHPGQFFADDAQIHDPHTNSAVLLWHGDAKQSEVAEFAASGRGLFIYFHKRIYKIIFI